MQISSRFTIAVHMLLCMEVFQDKQKVTSDFLASSVNANPVVIRRLLQQLKRAGIVSVKRGSGGAAIAKPLEQITLLDVYRAVDCVSEETLFHFHENPNQKCPVGRNIHNVLDGKLIQIQDALENELGKITLEDVMKDTQYYIAKERE